MKSTPITAEYLKKCAEGRREAHIKDHPGTESIVLEDMLEWQAAERILVLEDTLREEKKQHQQTLALLAAEATDLREEKARVDWILENRPNFKDRDWYEPDRISIDIARKALK